MSNELGLQANDRFAAVTTLSFDIAALEIFLPLVNGARLIIADSQTVSDGAALTAFIAQTKPSAMQATPATWRLLLASGWRPSPDLRMLCGGEALPRSLAEDLLNTGTELWNLYGPTETTIWSAAGRVTARDGPVEISGPVANTSLYVLNDALKPLPSAVAGELFIGGMGVAAGYHRRPDLTAEKFIPDPHSGHFGGRMYRTGDLVRLLAPGRLEFLGRLDYQVKIRGYRIELGEIESRLLMHACISEAAVIVRENVQGDDRLVTYCVPANGAVVDWRDVREHLAAGLPDYMIPSVFVAVEHMPHTQNGKLDRRSLESMPLEDAREPELIWPRDSIELRLQQLWEKTLGTSSIGLRDNFFELGGHSITSVTLLGQIREAFGANLSLDVLLKNPTVEQLAIILRQSRDFATDCSAVPLQVGNEGSDLFLVHPAGGSITCYFGLARHLGAHRNVYAFQSPGLYGEREPLRTIEKMAEYYVSDLLKLQPHGPVYLGGWSLGGIIAFEMARQLTESGREVGRVVLFDSSPRMTGVDVTDISEGEAMLRLVGPLLQLDDSELAHRDSETTIDYLLTELRKAQMTPPGVTIREVRNVLNVYRANRLAVARYNPGPYGGDILLYRTGAECASPVEEAWTHYASRVESRQALGTHGTLLDEPHVTQLARDLQTCLDALSVTKRASE
jgi:thioesterase domain-containing protein/acyl carrier protein